MQVERVSHINDLDSALSRRDAASTGKAGG